MLSMHTFVAKNKILFNLNQISQMTRENRMTSGNQFSKIAKWTGNKTKQFSCKAQKL